MSKRRESQCYKAYKAGLASRAEHPFVNGSLYKIKQRWDEYEGEPDNLVIIGLCKVKKGAYCNRVKHCMPDEMHWWVKRFPLQLCKVMGRDIEGAVPDLSKDGVSAERIDQIEDYLLHNVGKFLRDAEEARLYAKSNWQQTAREMSQGYGQMYDLCVGFLHIVSVVLEMVEEGEW